MADELLNRLNPAQRDAASWLDGPQLVLAGAGSGKTRVIVHRIAWLIESGHARPDQVLAVTFTNRAAREMRERLAELVGPAADQATVTTFHSACARWLRRFAPHVGLSAGFSIWDDDDCRRMLRECARELELPHDASALRLYASRIDDARNRAATPEELETQARSTADEQLADLYRAWLELLRRSNATDFGGLIQHLVHLLEQRPDVRATMHERYPHVLVDEFQDTNVAQYRLLQGLAPPGCPVTVVGDDDQSIYRWRGATVENVRRFVDDYAPVHIVRLEQNYRSTTPILEAAHRIVSRLEDRMDKKLFTDRADATTPLALICNDDRHEADLVVETLRAWQAEANQPWREMAIFYRTNAQSRVFEERLRASRIPYRIVGGVGFFDRREVRDVLAWLRVAANPADEAAFLRIANVPPRGLGSTTMDQLHALREDYPDARELLEHYRGRLNRRTNRRTREGLEELQLLLERLHRDVATVPSADLIHQALHATGYISYLQQDDPDTADERVRNVEELVNAARDVADRTGDPSLARFLEEAALESGDRQGHDEDGVQLMTVHTAKGLEFTNVIVTGMEDALFPLVRRDADASREHEDEERRLCYVAITRARDRLVLSAARTRRLHNRTRTNDPSVFLRELVPEHVPFDPRCVVRSLDWRHDPRGGVGSDGVGSDDMGSWGSGGDGRRDEWSARTPMWDEFDQRPWEERSSDSGSRRRGARAATIPEDGVVFDDSFYPQHSVDDAQRWIGRRAEHRSFGIGTVIAADPSGDRVRLTIRFPGDQTRKVIASYVTLLDD